ncbi:histidyl-tRNA synthetase [Rhodobium orientis]|uniref:Histidine--tRNA ligase n=1 Tax=Rhodobium orientis TaxID=34017 RepID=A0A327JRH5_9HYPH|nr:histidine--tRNA ligase [Rhodobium orientis]MBB4304168.1 histidyl-tRNA synthetase [Rhodobium orientis]MBK5950639.1 histidine--tRNA ligase [Rhodobium orientis]RAI28024.1 histidine--tRNA ligase [Rhodobium orientis]
MSGKAKADKLKARLPRGFVDREAAEIRATERMLQKVREIFERYGFDPVETPMIEYTDALGKFLPDQDRPNEGVFSFTDDDEQWLSLRYDLTAPLARHVAENFDSLPKPYRSYRAGWVFRNEKPGPGRFRQFMQFDADTVGAPTPAADAEMCMMMADTLDALGLEGQYVVRVNNRKVLDGVMEAIGLAGAEHAGTRLVVLRAVDKLDRLGLDGVRALLGEGRKDDSGDFTKGAGLGPDEVETVLSFVGAKGAAASETIETLKGLVSESSIGSAGVEELAEIARLVGAAGYEGKVEVDPSVVRGLEYYTGPVYEAELTFEVTNDKGQVVRFGSVAGGGRYDGLVGRFKGQDVPSTGFSIGVSRLLSALKATGKVNLSDENGPVIVTVMDRAAVADYQAMVSELRKAGVRAELFLGNPKQFGKQLQYADRRNAPLAIIQGSDERAEGVVQIKDLIEGKRLSEDIEDNAEWRAARPAQVTVPRTDLVEAVIKILAEQAADREGAGQ